VWYLAHHSPERTTVSVSIGRKADDHGPDDVRVSVSSRTAELPAGELERLFDPVRMVQENVIDIGPAVSQRIVEALGGRLELRHTRHDVGFVVHLPASV
jgi:K+-sensing histidine kinase KdpD